jgi:outer membrane receptor protein involved in Fe transport
MQEKGRALFKNNLFPDATTPDLETTLAGYQFGNSFEVVYDNLRTVRFFGELNADLSKNVSAGVQATLSSFSASNQAEAWNLPAVTLQANLDVTITEKWFAGANVFFVGERKDQMAKPNLTDPAFFEFTTVTLKSYFDVNANVGYQYNERLSFFLRGNNLLNQSYERWMNFPAQQIQVMLGANYKFDF